MEKKETPDAVYSSYAEMQEKEKDLAPISFSNGVGDQSRVIKVTEDLSDEYDFNAEFEAEVVPHIQPVRMFCQEHNIPFLFLCAPAGVAEVDDKGEKTGIRSTNCCVGYLPGKRTPAPYRLAADAVKDMEETVKAISSKALAFGRASAAVEIEEIINKLDDSKFDKETVIGVIRGVAAKFMLTSLVMNDSKNADSVMESLKEALKE